MPNLTMPEESPGELFDDLDETLARLFGSMSTSDDLSVRTSKLSEVVKGAEALGDKGTQGRNLGLGIVDSAAANIAEILASLGIDPNSAEHINARNQQILLIARAKGLQVATVAEALKVRTEIRRLRNTFDEANRRDIAKAEGETEKARLERGQAETRRIISDIAAEGEKATAGVQVYLVKQRAELSKRMGEHEVAMKMATLVEQSGSMIETATRRARVDMRFALEQIQLQEVKANAAPRRVKLQEKRVDMETRRVGLTLGREELKLKREEREQRLREFLSSVTAFREGITAGDKALRSATHAVVTHPIVKMAVPALIVGTVVANLVCDQPQYRDVPILGTLNDVWDDAYTPIRDGIEMSFGLDLPSTAPRSFSPPYGSPSPSDGFSIHRSMSIGAAAGSAGLSL